MVFENQYPEIVNSRVFVQQISPTVFFGYEFSHFCRLETAD